MQNWKRLAVLHRWFKTSRVAIDRSISGSRNTWFSKTRIDSTASPTILVPSRSWGKKVPLRGKIVPFWPSFAFPTLWVMLDLEKLPISSYRGSSILARIQLQSTRSSPGWCFIKTTKWWLIITSFAGLKNILKIHLRRLLRACWGGVIMTPSWLLEVEMKAINIFETGKWILTMLLWNMAVRSSSCVTIPLRYGGLGMDSHIGTLKLWPAPVFSCV